MGLNRDAWGIAYNGFNTQVIGITQGTRAACPVRQRIKETSGQ